MEKLDVRGHLRVMFAGDSIMAGINDTGGLRLPIMLGLQAMGVPARTVGEIDDGSSAHRVMYDLCAGNSQHQSIGGLTTAQLVSGGNYGGKTISPIETAIANLAPDVVFLAVGSNDAGTEQERSDGFVSLYTAIARARPGTAIVHVPPFASNNVANDFFNLDTNRETTARAARKAMETMAEDGLPGVVVDAHLHLAASVRRPGAAFNSATAHANAVFMDSAHLHPEGSAPIGCAAVAIALGMECAVVQAAIQSRSPHAPVPWNASATIATAGQTTLVASGPRKHRLGLLRLRNGGASAATVLLQTLRNPGAAATNVFTFTLGAGEVASLAWSRTEAPVAWVNEAWRLDVSGSGLNVEVNASGSSFWA